MNQSLLSLVLSVVTLLLVAFNTFGGNAGVMKALEGVEAMKVGGTENYEIVKKIYNSDAFKSQQKTSLEAAAKQMEGAAAPDAAAPDAAKPADAAAPDAAKPAETAPTAKKLTPDQIKKVLSTAIVKWPKDAKIMIVEYSDLQCPFCKRHSENGTLQSLIDKYPGKVAKTMKQFPLGFHQYAQKAGEAAYCFAGWDGYKYFKFISAVFAKDLNSNGSNDLIFTVNKEIGGNEAEFKTCIDGGKFAQQVKDDMSEWQTLFGVTGTPGNVILNTESGEYVVVAGAYPASEFEKTLELWTK